MKDKGLVYESIKYLETELANNLIYKPELAGAIRTVVAAADEALSMAEAFSAKAVEVAATEVFVPEPGLIYADPFGRFECKPAEAAWLENNPDQYLGALEFRVMIAHLKTALDNAEHALSRKLEV